MTHAPADRRAPAPFVATSGTDSSAAIEAFGSLYAGTDLYCRPVDEQLQFQYVGIGDELVSARRLHMDGYLRGEITTGNDVVVQWLTRGTARIDHGHHETALQPGTLTLLPAHRRFRIEYENPDQRLVHVNEDLLRDVAAERYLVGGVLTFAEQPTPDIAATAQWRASITDAVTLLRTDGPASPAWQEARRRTARALLRLYPLDADPIPPSNDSGSNARFSSALEYVQRHAHEPITVTDVAAAANSSIRSVQEAFQRHLHRSPTAYLREVRLDNIHTELQRADPADASVTDIAKRWRCNHMGRFSAAYAERFGEQPRRTLHAPSASHHSSRDDDAPMGSSRTDHSLPSP